MAAAWRAGRSHTAAAGSRGAEAGGAGPAGRLGEDAGEGRGKGKFTVGEGGFRGAGPEPS